MISIQDIINYYETINPNKSSSTYSVMKYNLIRLEKITQKDINDLSSIDFKINKQFIENLDKYALNTKIQTIMGIKLFLRFLAFKENDNKKYDSLINLWNDLLKTSCDENKKKIEKNEMTDNEEKNWIHYPLLKDKVIKYYETEFWQKLYNNSFTDYTRYTYCRNFLLLLLFIEIPPARIGNYQYMKIRIQKKRDGTSLDKSNNYLMIHPNGEYTFIFNVYKTAKYLGQVKKELDSDLMIVKVLNKYLEYRALFVNKKSNTDFLLNKDKKAMTQSNITDTLKYISRTVVGKDLSVNLLRHIFISHFFNENKTIEERKNVANFMGQTYEPTMMEKYNKIPKPPEEKKSMKFIMTFD